MVIANAENSAGGSGITLGTAGELFGAGVDILTSGDHLWDQKEITELMQSEPRFVRPANYPSGVIGQGSTIWRGAGLPPVGVLNLQGRTYMPPMENPFSVALQEVERLRQTTPIIFVDFHAEATSEKIAMGRLLDGKVSAVVGTHTHVQTADEQIFPGGTAFLTDAGFTGPQESVLGREITPILQKFLLGTPQRFTVASNRIQLLGAMIEIDNETGRATRIARVCESLS
jgi:metallophosphoesterase (TIGR00282 family)